MQAQLMTAFQDTFQRAPAVWVCVPGRVKLLGGGGISAEERVLAAPIDRALWLAAAPASERRLHINAIDISTQEKIPLDFDGDLPRPWLAHPLGVSAELTKYVPSVPGLDVVIHSNLPAGVGLGSSPALTLAFALAWNALAYLGLSEAELVKLVQRVEPHPADAAAPAVALLAAGDPLLYDGRAQSAISAEMSGDVVAFLADSGVRRDRAEVNTLLRVRQAESTSALLRLQQLLPGLKSLRDLDAATFDRVHTRLPEPEIRRARHVVGEALRVERGWAALLHGDMAGLGVKMLQSHMSARVNFDATIGEMDTLVESAVRVPGCYGARCAGDGWRGFVLVLARSKAVKRVQSSMASAFQKAFGREPRFVPIELTGAAQIGKADRD